MIVNVQWMQALTIHIDKYFLRLWGSIVDAMSQNEVANNTKVLFALLTYSKQELKINWKSTFPHWD